MRAAVFGGYGVFGSLVARELAQRGVAVVVAGRDLDRAEALARTLGPEHRACAADVSRTDSCLAALQGCTVAVNCAGPFGPFDSTLLEACLRANCHYADIADHRGYAALVRSFGERFERHGLAAVYGCSCVPALSGALALRLRALTAAQPQRVRVTLFIGNDNPKGLAALRSLLATLGQPIAAPQGVLRGFRDLEVVPLPPPFGRRPVFNFDSPEYDLFPALLGVRSVVVKVGFELRLATFGFALLALLGCRWGRRAAGVLVEVGELLRGLGCSGGAVMTELFYVDGSVRRAALVARRDGQRLAALPCALAAHALARGEIKGWGARTAYELLEAGTLLERLTAEGFELYVAPAEQAEAESDKG
jgi:hypothetical protein